MVQFWAQKAPQTLSVQFFRAPLESWTAAPKIMDIRTKSAFSCGSCDGEKHFDPWVSGCKGLGMSAGKSGPNSLCLCCLLLPLKTPNLLSKGHVSKATIEHCSVPSVSSLAITAFGGPEGYFSLAIKAFEAFELTVPKYLHRLGKRVKRSLASLISAIHLWGRSGRAIFRQFSAKFPQFFCTLS